MEKVLVVEDSQTSRLTLMAFVRQMGYSPIGAENGRIAAEVWEREAPRFVVTDWNMPEMNGLELVRFIRNQETDNYTFIVMVTSREEEDDLVRGFEAGVDDYLTKPVNKKELLLRLKAGERILALQDKDMIIFALAKLAETRDDETGEHIMRIRQYSIVLAQKMKQFEKFHNLLDRSFIENIYATSPLHDIGKVGIKDSILLKPAKLTAEEYELMKTHTIIGFDTLNSVYCQSRRGIYLKMAADIARSHHERWDGSGYPDGLGGEEIPLAARIVALADVYDALVSERVYKPPFTHEVAREIITNERGMHFDPDVVDAFLLVENNFRNM